MQHNWLEILANPLQFFFFIAEFILLGKTELNPAFIICLLLPLCWSLCSALLEVPCLCWGGSLACSTWNSTSFLWLSLRLVPEITNHTGSQLQTLTRIWIRSFSSDYGMVGMIASSFCTVSKTKLFYRKAIPILFKYIELTPGNPQRS